MGYISKETQFIFSQLFFNRHSHIQTMHFQYQFESDKADNQTQNNIYGNSSARFPPGRENNDFQFCGLLTPNSETITPLYLKGISSRWNIPVNRHIITRIVIPVVLVSFQITGILVLLYPMIVHHSAFQIERTLIMLQHNFLGIYNAFLQRRVFLPGLYRDGLKIYTPL